MKLRKILLIAAVGLLVLGPLLSYTATFQGVTLIDEQFTSFDGTVIKGTVLIPQGHQSTDKAPLIVLMHGFTASKEFFYPLAAELARHGYVCFSFNARGHQSSGNESSLAFNEIRDFQDAITYMLSKNATYGINESQIGIIGHSHGAMCATIVGALDSRVNATIPISTGANVTKLFAKFGNTGIIDKLRALLNIDLDFSNPAELEIRSPIKYVNGSYPSNLLLINGELDEAFSIQENQEILAKAIWNDTALAYSVVPGVVYSNSSGLRKLVVEQNVEHLMEAFMPETMNETVSWMDLVFYGGLRAPVDTTHLLLMFGGIMLTLLGSVFGVFVLASYLIGWTHKTVKKVPTTVQQIETKRKGFQFALYFGLFAVISALVPLLIFSIPGLHSWVPIMITDLVGIIFVFIALLSAPILIFLLWYEKRTFGTTMADYGLRLQGVGQSSIVGLILGVFMVAIISLGVSDFILKVIPASMWDFLSVFITFLPYVFVMELWGRGFIQMKLINMGKYSEILVSSVLVAILQGIGIFALLFVAQGILGLPTAIVLNENIPPINLPLIGMMGFAGLYFILSIFAGWVFQRTRNVLTSTFLLTIFLSWFLTAWPPRFI